MVNSHASRLNMSKKHNICIFDDDPFFSGMFARKFNTRGWNTTVIEDSKHMESCLDDEISIIVVDIESDNLEAKTIIPLLKSRSHTKNIPIVVITAVSHRKAIMEMIGHGVDAYLIKGHFVPNEVVDKVQRLLDSRSI